MLLLWSVVLGAKCRRGFVCAPIERQAVNAVSPVVMSRQGGNVVPACVNAHGDLDQSALIVARRLLNARGSVSIRQHACAIVVFKLAVVRWTFEVQREIVVTAVVMRWKQIG